MPCEDGRTAPDEAEMDVSGDVLAAGSDNKPENLLTCQLARIASCLPIFLTKDNSDVRALCPQGGVRSVSPTSLLLSRFLAFPLRPNVALHFCLKAH